MGVFRTPEDLRLVAFLEFIQFNVAAILQAHNQRLSRSKLQQIARIGADIDHFLHHAGQRSARSLARRQPG